MKKILLFLSLLVAVGSPAAELVPYNLECVARTNPVGVANPHPDLSWKLQSDLTGDSQIAYQILVASSIDLLNESQADLWNSGRVSSPETSSIAYAGKPLQSFQRCFWKVRAFSATSNSDWTTAAEWTTAILKTADQKGSWISTHDISLRPGPLPIYRKHFGLDKALKQAVLLVSGLGFADVYVNGKLITQDVLAPAWTNYRATVLYESYDVTSQLRKGSNAVGVMLGNGFYNVAGGRYAKYTGSFGVPRLWLQLHLNFTDGTSDDIVTDTSWKTASGPVTFSDIYGGEDFDARLEPAGWNTSDFRDDTWASASPIEAPGGSLMSDGSPPLRVIERFKPQSVTQPRQGVFIYDLGQNFSGWPRLAVSGPRGSRIRLTPGELLKSDGLVSQESSGGPNYFNYTLKGTGVEEWTPRFSYYGFRYVQVEAVTPEGQATRSQPTVHKLTGEFIHLDTKRTGHFSSSDTTLNHIHALIDAAVRSNLQHVLTDCPHREKLGWLEQFYLMGPSLLYDWDLRSFLPKVVRDIQDSQTTSGLIPDIAPEYVQFSGGFRDSPEWGSAGVMLPWFGWQYYADRKLLEAAYPNMRNYAAYLGSKADNGIIHYGLGDWFDIAPGPPGPSKLTPQGVTATATYFGDLGILAKAAELLGKTTDQQDYERNAKEESEQFQTTFARPPTSSYATGSQTALAMPLVLGLVPPNSRSGVLDLLVENIRSHGNHTTAGDVGYRYVIEALMLGGRSDVIYDMATERTPPSYRGQIAAGATTLTEAWDANRNTSQNHLMLGHIEEWFYGGLAGIRPDLQVPGLRHVLIEPQVIGGVHSVDASWETFRGPIKVSWHKKGAAFHLSVSIPPGITADASIPATVEEQVKWSEPVTAKNPAHKFLNKLNGLIIYALPSGQFDLEVRP